MENLPSWFPYIGYAGLIGYKLWDVFTTQKTNEAATKDSVRENLIDDLKTTVDRQEKKLRDYEERISTLEKVQVEKDAENRLMREILQGRDEKTKEYQGQWVESLKSIAEIRTDAKLILQSQARYDTYFENIKTATDIINRNFIKKQR